MNLRIWKISIVFLSLQMTSSAQIFNIQETKNDYRFKSEVLIMDVDHDQLRQITSNRNAHIKITLPFFNDQKLNLDLEVVTLHTEGFQLVEHTEKGKKIVPYEVGKYYKGSIENIPQSRVTLSIHGDEVSGVIWDGKESYDFGKMKDGENHILYRSESIDEDLSLQCATDTKDFKPSKQTFNKSSSSCSAVVEVYFECDFQMYQNFGSSSSNVTNYVNTMFAEMQSLYSNETIDIQISEIMVWTGNDGYSSGVSALTEFANSTPSFNGDVAHLLTNDTGANGGVAYVNQLCGNNPYAYSDILNSTNVFPTYSWDVQVVSHELGHNFGSPHTHDCSWGPNNNQQIDDCGNIAVGGGNCYDPSNPIVPSSGGTVMSYCHLNSVGINFNEGFGPEPGQLIRERHEACMCDNPTCDEASIITNNGIYSADPSNGNGSSSSSATAADWFEFTPDSDGTIDFNSCNQGVDTRVWLHSGSCTSMNFEALSDDNCTSSGNINYASEIIAHNVIAGTTYYIEWDNRWSSASFNWEFTFSSSGTSTVDITCPPTYNGANNCDTLDYHPDVTGYAMSNTPGAVITHSDALITTSCTVEVTRTWTSTDGDGQSAECVQIVNIEDEIAPVIEACPSSITIQSNQGCQANVNWMEPIVSDNCTLVTTSSNHNSGEAFNLGTSVVSYTFMDDCGNLSQCSFNVTVLDNCSQMEDCQGDTLNVNVIVDSIYIANQSINASGIISPNTTAKFQSGSTIELLPGFEIELGGQLEIILEPCAN